MISNKEKVIELIMEEFSKTIQLFGLTPLEARLYTYLYLSENAKTLDDMGEAVGHSKTAISTNIRSLVNMHLVKRVWKKGVRKDLYEANKQLYKAFMSFYFNKWMTEMVKNKSSLAEIQNELKNMANMEEGKTPSPNLESEINNLIDFHTKLEAALKKVTDE